MNDERDRRVETEGQEAAVTTELLLDMKNKKE